MGEHVPNPGSGLWKVVELGDYEDRRVEYAGTDGGRRGARFLMSRASLERLFVVTPTPRRPSGIRSNHPQGQQILRTGRERTMG